MKLEDYEKYYHMNSEFIIPRDVFEKIIEENQRLNNILNELEKWLSKEYMSGYYEELYKIGLKDCYNKLKELKESDK